jgi:hypothetical protein
MKPAGLCPLMLATTHLRRRGETGYRFSGSARCQMPTATPPQLPSNPHIFASSEVILSDIVSQFARITSL